MPNTIGNLPLLVLLNISYNLITGSIPLSFNRLLNIQYIDLSNNILTGNLEGKLNHSNYITSLLLQHNQLTGRIDDSILSIYCHSLQSIDYSDNYFTGKSVTLSLYMCICN